MSVELRDFILEHFSRDELLTFCADYFRDFYQDYSGVNITNVALTRELIGHCERRGELDNLRAGLQQARPVPYEARFGRIAVKPVATKPRDPRQVFVSHAHQDAEFAHRLALELKAEGLTVWIAPDSIQPGENWVRAIGRGLSESGIYVVALTPDAVQSPFVQQETEYAIQQHNANRGRLVPLLVKPCDKDQLSPLISTLQHIDFRSQHDSALDALFRSLGVQTSAERERLRREAEAEAARKAAETEAQRKRLAEEAARKQAEREKEERRQVAAMEAARKQAQLKEEERRQAAARTAASEEAQRKHAAEAAAEKQTGATPVASAMPARMRATITRRKLVVGSVGVAATGVAGWLLIRGGAQPSTPETTIAPTSAASATGTPIPQSTIVATNTASTVANPPTPYATVAATNTASGGISFELAPGVSLECVRIPGGLYLMGSDKAKDDQAFDDELPQHSVTLPDYLIGKTPVTNAQFEAFVQVTGYKTQAEKDGRSWAWNANEKKWEEKLGYAWRTPLGPTSSISDRREHPVIHVSWHDAIAFCTWLSQASGRAIALPSEAEWEKAARDTDGRIYPWGNQSPTDKLCNFNENIGDTTPVGRYSTAGDSRPYDCVDMAGNVWEWTRSLWGNDVDKPEFTYPYTQRVTERENLAASDDIRRVLRGGSWSSDSQSVRAAFRGPNAPSLRDGNSGFRVVCAPVLPAV